MKRSKRIIALLLAVALCLPLTGCQALETMRQEQGFWQEDGSVLWDGKVYLPLSGAGELNLSYEEDQPSISVTEPDVPVLLSTFMGEGMDVYQDGLLLESWTYETGGERMIYCRADRYEEIAARLAEGYEVDVLTYDYEKYDEEEWYVTDTYTFTAEQMAAVMDVYTTVIPTKPPEGMEFMSDYWVRVYGSSADGLFGRYLFDIELAGTTYYITELDATDEMLLYRVPEDKMAIFASILAPMIEEDKKFQQEDPFNDLWEEDEEIVL